MAIVSFGFSSNYVDALSTASFDANRTFTIENLAGENFLNANFGSAITSGSIDNLSNSLIKILNKDRVFSIENLAGENFLNANFGDGNVVGAQGLPSSGDGGGTTIINSVDPDPPIYRGIISGSYVYNIGSPPIGATNIVLVGEDL